MKKLEVIIQSNDGTDGYKKEVLEANPLLVSHDQQDKGVKLDDIPIISSEFLKENLNSRSLALLKHKSNTARDHWADLLPPLQKEQVDWQKVRYLQEKWGSHEAGSLVFIRRSNLGQIVVFIDHLLFDMEALDVKIHSSFLVENSFETESEKEDATGEIHAMGLGDVSGGKWASEVSSIVSLIGMTAVSKMPQVGIPVMIGGQVLSFIFGHIGEKKKTSIPSAEEIRETMKKVVENQHESDLSEEAYSVWSDYKLFHDKSWESGAVDDEQELDLFQDALQRAISLSSVGSVHDNVNKLHNICTNKDPSGNPVGLRHLPAFVYAGSIEMTCLEVSHNIELARSNAGRSDDPEANRRFLKALDLWADRSIDLKKKLNELLATSEAFFDKRLNKVGEKAEYGDVNSDPATPGSRMKTSITDQHHWEFNDEGAWPYPEPKRPAAKTYFSYTTNCCGTSSSGDVSGSKIDKKRDEYKKNLGDAIRKHTGVTQRNTIDSAYHKWSTACDIAAANKKKVSQEKGKI